MACGGSIKSGHCVADVLREIVAAQNNVVGDCCDSSCEQSIANLLGETPVPTNLDTVPVLLYCKDCEPFKGYGAPYDAIADVVGSFYFRVKSIDERNCAVLELLRTEADPADDPATPVTQFTGDLTATGICITVDVDCFCHVTCLPAISAL
ncbi:MAG TPA: spore coat protein [Bacilli bacterium]|nr:spore coat protein [Bacilli bacterium]